MNISSVSAPTVAPARPVSAEATEVPGKPDNDGDSDDLAAAAPVAKAPPPPGAGRLVDKIA